MCHSVITRFKTRTSLLYTTCMLGLTDLTSTMSDNLAQYLPSALSMDFNSIVTHSQMVINSVNFIFDSDRPYSVLGVSSGV